MTLVVHAGTPARPEILGGKAAALARLARAGLSIPDWFVVPPPAGGDSLSPDLLRDLDAAYAKMCRDGAPVAVRSSASDEDGADHSFAGQLESFLFVPPAEVAQRVRDVWKSGTSERVTAYRR